ncbi:outer membrane protein assembly factor BamB family protein [Dyadobacter fanqingshengii]|uniref:PQQ-binding-like beta-propeller repeat protein n=1 Tax=Dyadobacter fanqingshengii TaxID=2906443 RepID=A0A9X1PED4_9BACT|nr:PQQ-binding-like beta-propeller repeat protein [Dyadobacter fanqingshengii]MCF0041712.1 PQQ-binding-like beta-propeller repeat protein [Dyadobacter fanqingshengii]USJ36574.1 PQQ-binding-like beta-propeller repeat protein [Dyadobacter fanqingshengii]
MFEFLHYALRFFQKNISLALAAAAFAVLVAYQTQDEDRTWAIYKADAESTSYAPLSQINTTNVHQLQPTWTFTLNDMKAGSRAGNSECNPIIIDGVMYATSAKHLVYAVDAGTGRQIWAFDPFEGAEGGGVSRGVTYWENGDDKRILVTGGDVLFALNAQTGQPIPTFGRDGKVSMNVGLRDDPETISVIPTSPGIVYKDLLIMGAEVSELYGAQPGYIRAYNCVTGKLEWTFHTIPLPGEPGYETWPKDAYKYAGGVNDWAGMSLDVKRGIVFLALGSPSYDFYGADRKGSNLYGNSVVALHAATGKYIWHYQLVHHDLWDYDLPAPPNLVTVQRAGNNVDAVAQVTKHGFVFVFNRETGEPLFPIEERKVPASNIPGEEAWPTQPFPLKPKPFARQWMTEEDLTHYSDAGRDSIVKKFRSMRYEGLFTPPDLKGTLMLPGTRGGAEWGGAAYDPTTSVLFVKSNDSPEIQSMKKVDAEKEAKDQTIFEQGKTIYMTYCVACHGKDKNGDEPNYPSLVGLKNRMTREAALDKIKKGGGKMPAFASVVKGKEKGIIAFLYEREQNSSKVTKMETGQTKAGAEKYLNLTAYGHFRDPDGNPALRPPWGTLNAINLTTGEYEWQIPLGNNERLQAKDSPETGQEGSAGPIVTAGGLIFISGTNDKKLRAIDKQTGKVLWQTLLPGVANATACTYMHRGKQYVALSVGGNKENPSGSIMAFKLP